MTQILPRLQQDAQDEEPQMVLHLLAGQIHDVADVRYVTRMPSGRLIRMPRIPQDALSVCDGSKAFFDMLGVFAEFETNLRRERQAEGIKQAKKAEPTRAASAASTGRPSCDSPLKVTAGPPLRGSSVSRGGRCSNTG